MDADETILYWMELSDYDIATADAMLKTRRYLYVGFMAHQTIEKVLKAFHWHEKNEEPPCTHDLWRLCESSGLTPSLQRGQADLLDELQPLNIGARYPKDKDALLKVLTHEYCQGLLDRVRELHEWIKARC